MEKPQNNVVYLENALENDCGPALNHVIFNDLLEFQMRNNPNLAGQSRRDIAEACGMSESTLKNLCNGRNDNPRLGTLKRIVQYIGGGSLDRMVGFAPPRDFEQEEAQYDANLVEAIQIRLDEKRAHIEELEDRLAASEADRDRLRSLVLEKGEANSKSSAEVEALKKTISERDASILRRDNRYAEVAAELKREQNSNRKLIIALVALAAFVIVLAAVYIWDVSNLHKGLTAVLNPEIIQ